MGRGPAIRFTQIDGDFGVLVGGRGGWIINHRFVLAAEYRMGDLLALSMHTMHASPDNHTDQIRLSPDSRYQLASEPVDDRWVGENPPLHGIRAHRGMIC